MKPILLIHGGLHDETCWIPVIEEMASRGRKAVAFNLPGHGSDPTPLVTVGMEEYVASAEQALERLGEPATVVAHSMGGMIGTALAARMSEEVAALIYVAAAVPLPGQSFSEIVERAPDFSAGLRDSEDGVSHVVDPEVGRNAFYHDCPVQVADAATAALCPQPLRPFHEPMNFPRTGLDDIAKGYIRCTADRMVDQPAQHRYASCYPGTVEVEFESGHSPFLARPADFVDALLSLERRLLEAKG